MNPKYCSNCGSPADSKSKFCSNCGTSLFGAVLAKNISKQNNDKIEEDEDGEINLTLAKAASDIDFEITVPYEKVTGIPLKELIKSFEK
jgi:uncharacterized membrane protein YvbJ